MYAWSTLLNSFAHLGQVTSYSTKLDLDDGCLDQGRVTANDQRLPSCFDNVEDKYRI